MVERNSRGRVERIISLWGEEDLEEEVEVEEEGEV